MKKSRVITPLAVVVAGGLAYAAFSTGTFKAQAQQSAAGTDLAAKVARLEKQVESLQKKVDQLQRRPVVVQSLPSMPRRGANRVPRNHAPFQFNGQTYYFMPVRKGK